MTIHAVLGGSDNEPFTDARQRRGAMACERHWCRLRGRHRTSTCHESGLAPRKLMQRKPAHWDPGRLLNRTVAWVSSRSFSPSVEYHDEMESNDGNLGHPCSDEPARCFQRQRADDEDERARVG